MSQAIEAYYTITASSEFRERERLRAKARHDEAQALHNAELKGEAKGRQEERFNLARNMISDGESVEKIIRYTSLTRKEVELLYEQ